MNIDKTIERLEQMKKDAKTDVVRENVQKKIDILMKKKKQIERDNQNR